MHDYVITQSGVFCLLVLFLCACVSSSERSELETGEGVHQKKEETLIQDIPGKADALIQRGRKAEAEELLKGFVSKLPRDWKPVTELPYSIEIAYWSKSEFLSHVSHEKTRRIEKIISWVTPSYPQAFYLLSFLAVEREDWANAMAYVDQGLSLEPDHPLLLCEKALIFSRTKRHGEAYHLFMKAMEARPWTPPQHRARAMRGAAVGLIDLKRLDEAEDLLKKSLELEPDNEVAKHELGYIEHLRSGGRPTGKYDMH